MIIYRKNSKGGREEGKEQKEKERAWEGRERQTSRPTCCLGIESQECGTVGR